MAWTVPKTFVVGAVLTAAEFNTYLRDNLNECAPAKATTAGFGFKMAGTNSIVERAISSSTVATSQTTTSVTYADLATVGPAVTLTTGSAVITFCNATQGNSLANVAVFTSVACSGANTQAASDAWALLSDGLAAANQISGQRVFLFSITTPGVNTFTMKYRVNSGTATIANRELTVIGL